MLVWLTLPSAGKGSCVFTPHTNAHALMYVSFQTCEDNAQWGRGEALHALKAKATGAA